MTKDLSFEAALSELEKIVHSLESGKAGLEESIALYERGTQLRQHCEAKLKDAQLRVEKLTLENGQPKLEKIK
jgi:exodeoxyribonuclease VII small subunit